MTYILESNIVYVVIHIHSGVIFNTAVFAKHDEGMDFYHRMKREYCHEDSDDIDFQKCVII